MVILGLDLGKVLGLKFMLVQQAPHFCQFILTLLEFLHTYFLHVLVRFLSGQQAHICSLIRKPTVRNAWTDQAGLRGVGVLNIVANVVKMGGFERALGCLAFIDDRV